MQQTVLTDTDIRAALRAKPPLLEGLVDTATQIQACGVDLTVHAVSRFLSAGAVDFDNSQRVLAEREPLPWQNGCLDLPCGAYHIVYNEVVNLPKNIMAIAYPRSSLLRCGVAVYSAVWDPGYSGRAEGLMVVHNPGGFRLWRSARVVQLVFTALGGDVSAGYDGRYHGENLGGGAALGSG